MRSISIVLLLGFWGNLLSAQTGTRNDASSFGNGENSGFFETSAPVNYPAGAESWWHLLDVRHSNTANNFSMQIAGSFYDQDLFYRKTNNYGQTQWSRFLSERDGYLTSGRLWISSGAGQSFFYGKQAGAGYTFGAGIFRAETDNPDGSQNTFFDGITAGNRKFSVRADGTGYLYTGLGIGIYEPQTALHIAGDQMITMGNYESGSGIRGIHFTGFRDVQPNYFGASMEAVPEWLCCNFPGTGYPGIKKVGMRFYVHGNSDVPSDKLLAMNIRSDGNVGIGSESPGSKLEVAGALNLKYASSGDDYFFKHTDLSGGMIAGMKRSGNSLLMKSYDSFKVVTGNDVSETPRLTVLANGNVGLGTANPNTRLALVNAYSGMSLDPGTAPYFGSISFNREAATGGIFNAQGNAFQINNGPDGHFHIQVYRGDGSPVSSDGFFISGTNANVGIGTKEAVEKLTVNGKIKASEIRVNGSGLGDYVFETDYPNMPLDQLENYIRLNQHLPEMPTAAEAEKNGLEIGEMSKLLLKKIEELTLHLIEKDKQVRKLESAVQKMAQLETELSILKALIYKQK
ncbi:hypothetical protein [Pedobacter frigidisoli]|uniref:hypothetical protein n=1 Tax=Pedobacter frigidisoli TaxID=2530455 RepID=UPI00292F7831|nr:hypothetical protein [Pedobacter frigidisoli]